MLERNFTKFILRKNIKWDLVLGFAILSLLLFKNPFSGANSISDLGPFPDVIHYLSPVKSLFDGNGLKIAYEGRQLNTAVPFLYSLTIAPFYAIFKDPRSFYVLNVLLSLFSAILFYRILSLFNFAKLVRSLAFFAYVSNYIIFWYPTMAMAENLLLLLYLASIYLLMVSSTFVKCIIAGLIAVSFYFTKYVGVTLTLSLGVMYAIKIMSNYPRDNTYWKKILTYLFTTVSVFGVLSYVVYLTKGLGLLPGAEMIVALFKTPSFGSGAVIPDNSTVFYSLAYFGGNFIQYLAGLMGGKVSMIGIEVSLFPVIIGLPSLLAFLINPVFCKYRTVSFYLLVSLLLTLLLICGFYQTDARYILIFIPASIISFALLVNSVNELLVLLQKSYLKYGLTITLFTLVLYANYPMVLKSLRSNFFEKEQLPLGYTTVKTLNSYFTQKSDLNKPVVITTLTPHFVDFYSNNNYKLIPLTPHQFFTNHLTEVWGENDYWDYIALYKKYITLGYDLYISDLGTDERYYQHRDFQKIQANFNLAEVMEGCEGKCNLYKISLKGEEIENEANLGY